MGILISNASEKPMCEEITSQIKEEAFMELAAMKAACLSCTACSLRETCTQVVFGGGNPQARVMLVGEAPGKSEDLQGQPFVGRSGQLLDCYLASIGLFRHRNVFITNLVKCRPPENRDPLPCERAACLPHLQAQLAVLRPKIVICLGRIAAQRLIRPDFSVMQEHGTFTQKGDIWFTATLHPAALLRSPSKKPLAEADFARFQEKINAVCPETFW